MKVFQYCVIYSPNEAAKKDGKKAELIVPVKTILANDIQQANLLVAREVPEEYLDRLDQIDVAIRPF
jgi:hypothetical protein